MRGSGSECSLATPLPVSATENPTERIAVSCTDSKLRIVSQAANQTISITTFGGDAAGHKGKINDICFCTTGDAEGKYLASVGGEWAHVPHLSLVFSKLIFREDDKACVLWDLYPVHAKEDYAQEFAEDAVSLSPADIAQSSSPFAFRAEGDAPTSNSPLAYPIYFGKPLHTVSSHRANARSILASRTYLVLYREPK
jgi:hypothetical protein